jgi:hypothetical protein
MHREDTRRKAPKWTFSGRGAIFSVLDEDDPAVMAVAATTADELDGTCEISGR